MNIQTILEKGFVQDESVSDAILRILGDKCSRKILEATLDSPKSALQISKECKISLGLVYRKLQKLLQYKLIQASGAIADAGRKHTLFRTKANAIMIVLNGKYPSQTVVLEIEDLIQCEGCGSLNCAIYYDERYHGMRSKCNFCGSNWPES